MCMKGRLHVEVDIDTREKRRWNIFASLHVRAKHPLQPTPVVGASKVMGNREHKWPIKVYGLGFRPKKSTMSTF